MDYLYEIKKTGLNIAEMPAIILVMVTVGGLTYETLNVFTKYENHDKLFATLISIATIGSALFTEKGLNFLHKKSLEHKVNKQTDKSAKRNKKLLESFITLWKQNPDAIPEELHALCQELHAEYATHPQLALQENAALANELHELVLQKSTFYQKNTQIQFYKTVLNP